MSFALAMALVFASLVAARQRHPAQLPLFSAALIVSALVFHANANSNLGLSW